MAKRSKPYNAGLRFLIERADPQDLQQVLEVMKNATETREAFEAAYLHRRRLAKRFGREEQVTRRYTHKELGIGQRRIAWNTLQNMKRNERITISPPDGNGIRWVSLNEPPTTAGRHARTLSWQEVLRDIYAQNRAPYRDTGA